MRGEFFGRRARETGVGRTVSTMKSRLDAGVEKKVQFITYEDG